jgi:hypothetical protein
MVFISREDLRMLERSVFCFYSFSCLLGTPHIALGSLFNVLNKVKKLVPAATLLAYTRKVPSVNIDGAFKNPEDFHGFLQSLHVTVRTVP